MHPMQRIRVLLADDHPLLREGIQRVLDADPRLLVVGAAEDGLSALSLAETHHPDVVLLDINMPGLSGIDVARSLTQRQPGIGIVMLTMREDDALVVAAIQAGARAYCHKDAEPARLLDVVHRVARGEYLMAEVLIAHPDLATQVRDQGRAVDRRGHALAPRADALTARELEVLACLADGQRNKEIAVTLALSESTIKNRITSILRKLHVTGRTEAVMYAIRHGWIDVSGTDLDQTTPLDGG